ncbi:MAG: MGDG synthase family glycosyltransferase [Eggerthellaceae bacterium]
MITTTCDAHSQRPLVILTYASVGSGHRSAAQAIAQALEDLCGKHPALPADAEIAVLDILDYGYVRFDGDKTANVTVSFNGLYDFTWHHFLTGRLLWAGGYGWSPCMFSPFTKLVKQRKPIAIISTHIVAANAAVAARMLSRQLFPVVCVPTDYGAEGLWPHLDCDLFCAADEEMVEELLPRKVPESHIKVTGIPVRKGFSEPYDREAVLAHFGLPSDKMNVIVMAGARLAQPYMPFREIVNKTVPNLGEFDQMHFAFLAGADEEYAQQVHDYCAEHLVDNVSVFNYIEDIPGLMESCDLIIAKSGGLATTECLCARLPLLLVGKSYGQERANTCAVTNAGAAVTAITSAELLSQLHRIHDNPSCLDAMRSGGEALRRPYAARDAALATLDLVGTIKEPKRHFLKVYWGKKPHPLR